MKIECLFNAKIITGNFCHLHQIEFQDAGLIFDLRTKRSKDNYLKITYGDVSDQEKYLAKYFERFNNREEIYYKIFDIKNKQFSGVVRITELNKTLVFNWQSFVVFESVNPNIVIDVILMIYRIGFDFLDRNICGKWEVDKNFDKMIKINSIMNMAKIVGENEKFFLFEVKKFDFVENYPRYKKMGFGFLGNLL
jgi:hypothetical protein